MLHVRAETGKADLRASIFAIHGLGSDPDSAWTYTSNTTQVCWLSDLLPRSKGLETARAMMVNHQTRWDSNTASMDLIDYASELLGHIEGHHKASPLPHMNVRVPLTPSYRPTLLAQ